MTDIPKRPPLPPLLVIFFGILAVSTASIFIRYAQQSAPSLAVAAARLTMASLVLAPIAFFRHRQELLQLKKRELGLASLSGIFLALHFATWISSLEYTTVASSVVLVTTTPLFVALLAPIFLREPLTRIIGLGMALALIGGIIVSLSDTCTWNSQSLVCPPISDFIRGKAFVGDLLALAGAVAAACYIMIGRNLRAKMSLVGYIFLVYGMAAMILISVMIAAGQTLFGYPPETYLWFILLALVPQLMGHTSFNWALGYLSAAFVSITLLGEPIGSTILAYIVLQETPSILKIFGAILILTGILISSSSERKRV